MQEKKPKYPYPVPELIEHLELMQQLTQDDEHAYGNLVRLLKICHATMQHAHEVWYSQRYMLEGPEIPTYDAMQYGFSRLVPLMLDNTVSGWHELLVYIEHPEKYAWYDPEYDWPQCSPLQTTQEEEMCDEACCEAP